VGASKHQLPTTIFVLKHVWADYRFSIGIYKSEVVRARANLLAMWHFPPINGIRGELGNTDSEGTPHDVTPGRFQPDDQLLAFLKEL